MELVVAPSLAAAPSTGGSSDPATHSGDHSITRVGRASCLWAAAGSHCIARLLAMGENQRQAVTRTSRWYSRRAPIFSRCPPRSPHDQWHSLMTSAAVWWRLRFVYSFIIGSSLVVRRRVEFQLVSAQLAASTVLPHWHHTSILRRGVEFWSRRRCLSPHSHSSQVGPRRR